MTQYPKEGMLTKEIRGGEKWHFELTSFGLHVLAMVCMLSDHLWATVMPWDAEWMTCLGRLAFPIFAFLTVEGFFYTKNRKRYARRLFLFAVLSEIPFNLMLSGGYIYPFHQNVLWCFLLCLGLMQLNEKAKSTGKWWVRLLTAVGAILLGTLAGMLTMIDYMQYGVWMVLAFYFLRGKQWWNYVAQFVCFALINWEISGYSYEVAIFGKEILVPQQCFALLAFLPIWLYKGKQGYHSKGFQYLCYAFYPVHLLILGLIMRFR